MTNKEREHRLNQLVTHEAQFLRAYMLDIDRDWLERWFGMDGGREAFRRIADPVARFQEVVREAEDLIARHWEVFPHGAMEKLETLAEACDLETGKPLVRRVVEAWRRHPEYDWHKGGAADRCYLAALLMTDNGDLAEPELIDRCAAECLQKADRGFHRMVTVEAEVKAANVRRFLASRSPGG